MVLTPCQDTKPDQATPDTIAMEILPRTTDIGNFEVHRALPFQNKRMVGPFIFWDQMGPGEFLTDQGLDVRPHPHIGLSTVSYLFDGTMDHKDSCGNDMRIVPGDVNLMTAGKGITHSERSGKEIRQSPSCLFGIQSWIAQPKAHENGQNGFHHEAAEKLPFFDTDGVSGRLILGSYEGLKSPVPMQWDTHYVDCHVQAGKILRYAAEAEERAIYIVKGVVEIAGVRFESGRMLVCQPGQEILVTAAEDAHVMLLGGAVMDGPRYIWWNFVASDKDMIRQAAENWQNNQFPTVPGDEEEFIPLPDKNVIERLEPAY